MARSKEEIISEMVDSGLFSDDEIRDAVKKSGSPPEEKGMVRKAWDALAVPEKMSREGLTAIADAIPSAEPTGNLARDIALNIPKVAAETLAETAPGFVSRESIVTGGALKAGKAAAPLIKATGRAVAKAAESASGLEYRTPGVLTEAAKDSKLMFDKGTKAAGKLYGKTRELIRPEMKKIPKKEDMVEQAMKWAEEGTLNSEEALAARKALDKAKNKFSDEFFVWSRDILDGIAKQKFQSADKAFARAIKTDALRQPLPINKYGGTSIFKSSLGGLAGVLPLVAMSPAAQGSVATLLGILARSGGRLGSNAIRSGSGIGKLLELANRDPNASE